MSYIGFSISNPFVSPMLETIWSTTKPVSKNKFIELEVFKMNTIFNFEIIFGRNISDATVSIEFGMFNISVLLSLFDSRVWDHFNNTWVKPN